MVWDKNLYGDGLEVSMVAFEREVLGFIRPVTLILQWRL